MVADTRAQRAGGTIVELERSFEQIAHEELERLERRLPDLDEESRQRVRETIADFRAALVRNLYQGLLNQRLNERILDANPPYISAYSYLASYLRTRRFFVQGARVKENAFAEGLEALLLEARRVKRDGFTQSELERLKLELLRDLEQTFRERDKSYSSGYASGYVSHFLTQSPTPGEENMLKLARAFVPAITLDEVNRVADGWITKENRVILISAPQKEGLTVPDAEAVLALMKASEKKEIEAYKDDVPDEPLLKEKPAQSSSSPNHGSSTLPRFLASERVYLVLSPNFAGARSVERQRRTALRYG